MQHTHTHTHTNISIKIKHTHTNISIKIEYRLIRSYTHTYMHTFTHIHSYIHPSIHIHNTYIHTYRYLPGKRRLAFRRWRGGLKAYVEHRRQIALHTFAYIRSIYTEVYLYKCWYHMFSRGERCACMYLIHIKIITHENMRYSLLEPVWSKQGTKKDGHKTYTHAYMYMHTHTHLQAHVHLQLLASTCKELLFASYLQAHTHDSASAQMPYSVCQALWSKSERSIECSVLNDGIQHWDRLHVYVYVYTYICVNMYVYWMACLIITCNIKSGPCICTCGICVRACMQYVYMECFVFNNNCIQHWKCPASMCLCTYVCIYVCM
jgi:hypothetical protein